jgi:hypothetical protein
MRRGGRRAPKSAPAAADRRAFLGALGAGAAATLVLDPFARPGGAARAAEISPAGVEERRHEAYQVRVDAARLAYDRPVPPQTPNGDDDLYPTRFASYSKGLPHDRNGEVDGRAYDLLRTALGSGDPADFERIPLGLGRPLTNPQAGLAFDLEGPDAQQMALPPAPRFDSAEEAGEMAEVYWMALLREVPFFHWGRDRGVQEAADDLGRLGDFRGPKVAGRVTPATLFRGSTAGDLAGPYVSQFLLKTVPYGSLRVDQRMETSLPAAYLTHYDDWLAIQNGAPIEPYRIDPRRRYIRSMLDLTHYVHVDALYEAYLNAALILLGDGAPLDPGNPYAVSRTQIGFGTWGGPHILSLVTEVATRALKCVWYQKWFVHRRLRPEEFGGRVHNHLSGAVRYPIHDDLLRSRALDRVRARHRSWLLPMAFPEGSPTHPAYGAGHATVAGACVTILKAWFDDSHLLADPVQANEDGTALVPYIGPDREALTVGGELDKIAANIAIGRNMAGVHWRSDYRESIKLGEAIAIGMLEEQKATYNEGGAFSLTRFDGTRITI